MDSHDAAVLAALALAAQTGRTTVLLVRYLLRSSGPQGGPEVPPDEPESGHVVGEGIVRT